MRPAEFSRYCRLSTRYPVPSEDASGFVETVLEFARKNEIELIIPVTDLTIAPLSKYRDRFQGVSRLALGPHAPLELAADKFQTVCLARELRIPVPETALVSSIDDLGLRQPANWDFPVVVKDRFSVRWKGNRAVLGSVAYAYSMDDLEKKVEHRLKEAGDVLVQQFVAGRGHRLLLSGGRNRMSTSLLCGGGFAKPTHGVRGAVRNYRFQLMAGSPGS